MVEVFGVCFDDSTKIYYFLPNGNELKKNDYVVVETNRGQQFGVVSTDKIVVDKNRISFELKNVLKVADSNDIGVNEKNIKDAEIAIERANKFIDELDLNMKILDASFTFDRSQLLFNFLADSRVDFRELAKKLAYIYKTRIELRQIGVRDKAKCIGGYGICGKKLCCSTFLNDFNSVSINMAKNQNLALNPQKINGVCGRLMCCLGYENELYNEYKKDFPKVGEIVSNDSYKGKVVYVDLFKKMYKLELEDGKVVDVML
jgi:cell fate regulator YaaT (PSP1 superfamily)